MFKITRKRSDRRIAHPGTTEIGVGFEMLESRKLLSGSGFGGGHGHGGGHGPGDGGHGGASSTIAFSLAPVAVQTGLDTLAEAAGLADPTATAKVQLGNRDGIETYSVTLTGTGTVSRFTVDQAGLPVTAPTVTTSDFGTLGTTSAAAAAEISAIATALGAAAPTSATVVHVVTTSGGAVTYSVSLAADSASTSTSKAKHFPVTISVDAAGNPVGNQRLPFSVIPATVQTALNSAGIALGSTALAADSTQAVNVRTIDGVVTYSTTFTSSGTTSTVAVTASGAAAIIPSNTSSTFGALSQAQQDELSALATAAGVTTAFAATDVVTVHTEANGATLYSITGSATTTDSNGKTHTRNITLTVDADANPTVLPGGGGPGGGGDCGPSLGGGGTTTTSVASSAKTTASSSAKAASKRR